MEDTVERGDFEAMFTPEFVTSYAGKLALSTLPSRHNGYRQQKIVTFVDANFRLVIRPDFDSRIKWGGFRNANGWKFPLDVEDFHYLDGESYHHRFLDTPDTWLLRFRHRLGDDECQVWLDTIAARLETLHAQNRVVIAADLNSHGKGDGA